MKKFLVPVDGSDRARRALDYAVERCKETPAELHLLNVQLPIASGNVRRTIGSEQLNDFLRDEAMAVLSPLRDALAARDVVAQLHIGVGDPGEVVAAFARDLGCSEIIMSTRGTGAWAGFVLGSVATKVAQHASIPVTLVK